MKRGSKEFNTMSRIYGVSEKDSQIEGALKALEVAKSVFGANSAVVKKAERMIAEAKARGVK